MTGKASGGRASGGRTAHLPPPLRAMALREGDPFTRALEIAGDAAGTLVFASHDRFEWALVLEPETPLCEARRVHHAGMLALLRTVTVLSPATGFSLLWPSTLLADDRPAGEARLGWPEGTAEDEVPDWLVFGARLGATGAFAEPGPEAAARLAEIFSARFLAVLNLWHDGGFSALGEALVQHMSPPPGVAYEIDGQGDLLVRHPPGKDAERQALGAALDPAPDPAPDPGLAPSRGAGPND